MSNIIVKKWIEPYVLLETYKKHFSMQDFTFDGFSKNDAKSKMLKLIADSKGLAFGLYMKNVNKFYVFISDNQINADKLMSEIGMQLGDYEFDETTDEPITAVDLAKAEAALILSTL